jgi:propionate CoA-transferase
VFSLSSGGLRLEEIAPGIDIKRDVLDQMAFPPIVENVRLMDACLFADTLMGL